MYRTERRNVWSILAVVLFAASAANAGTLALDLTAGQTFAAGSFTNIGWSFTVNSTVTADGLGLFDTTPNGLSAEHQVGLWNGSGTLLAQTTINNASTVIASASSAGR